MSKITFLEFLNESSSEKESEGWYIVYNEMNTIQDGPFLSKSNAISTMKSDYNDKEYTVGYGKATDKGYYIATRASNPMESSDVTDYNPKSPGGTRNELLRKLAKTKSEEDATAARKAGATQRELQAALKESISLVETVDDDKADITATYSDKKIGAATFQVYGTAKEITVEYDITYRRMSPQSAQVHYKDTINKCNAILAQIKKQYNQYTAVVHLPAARTGEYSEYEQEIIGYVVLTPKKGVDTVQESDDSQESIKTMVRKGKEKYNSWYIGFYHGYTRLARQEFNVDNDYNAGYKKGELSRSYVSTESPTDVKEGGRYSIIKITDKDYNMKFSEFITESEGTYVTITKDTSNFTDTDHNNIKPGKKYGVLDKGNGWVELDLGERKYKVRSILIGASA